MEAVGQLTGGIAHDFNNLLTAVGGNLELLRSVPDADRDALVGESLDAVHRASELIRRLLAFSRRQELRPELVGVAARLEGTLSLLERTLGAHIDLELDVRDPQACTLVDPVQLDSALLNLAINARDAMPEGGRLALAVDTVVVSDDDALDPPSGHFVRVSVVDTGSGIAPELLPHVIEPFFTTKAQGEGTGLGLSMVYGFARQSGGTARVESTPGRGTRVSLLLPRLAAPEAAAPGVAGAESASETGAPVDASVLVVEDEAAVRRVITAVLERIGARVTAVADGDAAVAAVEAGGRWDLVLSDVVLPGERSGVDVLRVCRAALPSARFALMSGYPRDHLASDDPWIQSLPLLAKPFRLEALEALVRERLSPDAGE
jgi:CheY-like chemotaxis protein